MFTKLQATNTQSIILEFSAPKALQIGERELKKLRLEVKSLQTECQQGKTLIKSLTQVKGEKSALEEKVCNYLHTVCRCNVNPTTRIDGHAIQGN